MTTPRVLGLDLGLSVTGVAGNWDGGWTATVRPKKLTGLRRIQWIRDTIYSRYLLEAGVDLAVVEGPSFGSSGGSAHERAGLWWLIAELLDSCGVNGAVLSPTGRAQYATGNGLADKQRVLQSICRDYPWFSSAKRPGIQDEADALALCAAGADHLGVPMAALPPSHRKALAAVRWPSSLARATDPADIPLF